MNSVKRAYEGLAILSEGAQDYNRTFGTKEEVTEAR